MSNATTGVLGFIRMVYRRLFYRRVMRIAHRLNWHYAPPSYPDGDTHLWCQWCGFRQTVKRRHILAVDGGCDKSSEAAVPSKSQNTHKIPAGRTPPEQP
jgi:hypothetical protein